MINLSWGQTSPRHQVRFRARPGSFLIAVLLTFDLYADSAQHAPEASAPDPSPPASARATDADATVGQHQAALDEMQARLAELRASIADRVAYRDALLAELRVFEQDIADLTRANRQLSAMIATQQAALADISARLNSTRAELAHARAVLAELLRMAHQAGHDRPLRLLVGQADARRQGRILGYYRVLAAERAARVAEIGALRRDLAALEQQGRDEALRLQRLASRQEQTRLRMTRARGARAAILSDLDGSIDADRTRVAALHADAEALKTLIDELKRRADIAAEAELDQIAIAERRGQLAWPLPATQVLRPFGAGRAQGALHADGVLLEAEPGSEVRAVHHGRVAYADWLRGFGMLLVIDHGGGYMTLYGHNQALLKEVGEWVAGGDVIALSGSTGGAVPAALYFAIRYQGQALDPAGWCRSRRG
jgi:septal ring factor EnvC (AmiA/AmiB activator)